MTPAATTRNGCNHKAHYLNPYDSDSGSNNEEYHLSPPPLDVNPCKTVDEIHVALTHLTTQNAYIESKLCTLLLKQSELNAEVPDLTFITLESAAESLCGLLLREFEHAVEARRFVCQGTAAGAKDELVAKRQAAVGGAGGLGEFFYADPAMGLFAHIANIVKQHGKFVGRHYGEERIGKVSERLQVARIPAGNYY
ncbi:hypothetical protein B9Z19DRAFT_1121708 [Tuber borchii]|uniref:COG4 transport protein middle alpha-helical bundle domain-containing protein n=1 Tax=Tuber borchii TaxID=42251 RepID=A0A2T7A243_TUBBO|nr:hypothetical protein B9Z19DRAFT_1121708 [Tuber borchii]